MEEMLGNFLENTVWMKEAWNVNLIINPMISDDQILIIFTLFCFSLVHFFYLNVLLLALTFGSPFSQFYHPRNNNTIIKLTGHSEGKPERGRGKRGQVQKGRRNRYEAQRGEERKERDGC